MSGQGAAVSPLTLFGTPYPESCDRPVKTPGPHDEATCCRDRGHKGPHRGWCHPSCDYCGAEMKYHNGSVSYSCNHAGVPREVRDRGYDLAHARKVIAYAMTGYPASGRAPTSDQFMAAQQAVVNLSLAGADDVIDALRNEAFDLEAAS